MRRVELPASWTLTLRGDEVPARVRTACDAGGISATVPGCVHTDLMAAGLVDDPFLDRNELAEQWIARADAGYTTSFDAEPLADGEHAELVFEGIVTVATVRLNGVELGRVANMHRTHRFDVTAVLAERNRLEVDIEAPLTAAERAQEVLGARPVSGNPLPYNAVRTMACNFGWDWGPELITSGLWRPVHLERWSQARLTQVVPVASVDLADADVPASDVASAERGTVRVRAGVRADAAGEGLVLRARVLDADGREVAAESVAAMAGADAVTDVELRLGVERPELWWPVGEGDQPLYRVEVELVRGDRVLDSFARRVGFRAVELRLDADEFGTGFVFVVNGRPLYIRGANWIPDDVFVSRVGRDQYAAGVRDALEANMNLLRIWGGGLYASDELAELCDESGLLLWQDFLFACAAYAEEEPLAGEVEAEARENIARLASHPSLVLWNGNNENVEGYVVWGWQSQLAEGQTWGLGYYTELLPRLVDEVDGTRPYTPTSPYNPADMFDPRNPDHGSSHQWVVWNRLDYTTYRETVPRFCAEFGFQGPATWPTIAEYVHDDPIAHDSPGMLLHEKAFEGDRKLTDGYAPHLPTPTSFADWHLTTSLNQARAIECGISRFRSWWPRSSGAVVWQLNDCWPVSSWAAVDSRRRRKLLWYSLRDLFADHFVTLQPRDAGLAAIASNLGQDAWSGTLTLRRLDLSGHELAAVQQEVRAEPRATVLVDVPAEVAMFGEASREVIVAELDGVRAFWWGAEDVDLALEPPSLEVELTHQGEQWQARVRALVLVKDAVLVADRQCPDVVADTIRSTLLPGESRTFSFTAPAEASFDAATLVDSVNGLLARARG